MSAVGDEEGYPIDQWEGVSTFPSLFEARGFWLASFVDIDIVDFVAMLSFFGLDLLVVGNEDGSLINQGKDRATEVCGDATDNVAKSVANESQ